VAPDVGRDSAPELDGDTLVLSGFTAGAFFAERFRLEKLLGIGAMGKVFRATDTATDVPVAVKVLHPDKARRPQVLARFRREAEILQGLGHPGIVRVVQSGRSTDGIDFLAMELLEGRTLKDRVRGEGPLSPEEMLPILVAICDAVGAAHQQGVIHRDLKPDNVFLVDDGGASPRVKIVDFGLSRLSTNARITKTGVSMGTPRYMAPEQIRSAKDADGRTDIYACGVMVHESLTGGSPFPAGDPGQLLGCIMEGRVLQLEEQRPELPAELGPVIRRAMAKDPGDRYATIGAFAEAFARVLGRSTGRSMLAAGDFDALFGDVEVREDPGSPGELSPPSGEVEVPRFTLPPSPSSRPARVAPAKERSSSRAPLALALFLVALVAVVCLAAAAALGLRYALSDDGPSGASERASTVGE
jgi:serine/threonine-protein kinase